MAPSQKPTFCPLERNEFGSTEKTGNVIVSYAILAQLFEEDSYKMLQAVAKYLSYRQGDEQDGDDDDDDEVLSVVEKVGQDFKPQLSELEKLGGNMKEIMKKVQEADRTFSHQFREAMARVGKIPRRKEVASCFANRLLDYLDAHLSDADKRVATGPVGIQLDLGDATDDQVSRVVISWLLGRLYSDHEDLLEQIVAPLKEPFLSDTMFACLQDEVEKAKLTVEGTDKPLLEEASLHEDLRLGDLSVCAIDLIVLPFISENTRNGPLSPDKWKILDQDQVIHRLANLYLPDTYTSDTLRTSEEADRTKILDKATSGSFAGTVQPIVKEAVKANLKEVVYNCWALMLSDLYTTITDCVTTARTSLNPRAAGRRVVRNMSHTAVEDLAYLE